MGIYSLKNKVLNEEKDWSDDNVINIGVAFDEFGDPVFYTDKDLLNVLNENTFNYPNIKLLSDKKQKVVINLVPYKSNDTELNPGARIKFKSRNGNDIGTRSLVFDRDNKGNPIPIVSIYPNQDKDKNEFKSHKMLDDYMLDTAFSFVQSNPRLIEDFFLGKRSYDDLVDYVNTFNKFSNKKKKEYADQIIRRK